MSLQHLNNLTALQVPDIHLLVLAARDDPFTACNAEARSDTVLRVLMPDICLQTPRRLVVPKSNRVIVRC